MFKNFFLACALGVSLVGLTCCTVGCGGPGPVVEGTANNDKFADTDATDDQDRKIPKGLGEHK